MFGNCEECAYCRLVKTKKGDEFHVCARHAPVQSIDRYHEQPTFPIVQVYGKAECIEGCGEFTPDYERIKAKARKELEDEREKITESAREWATERRKRAEEEASEYLAIVQKQAVERGQEAIEDEIDLVIKRSVQLLTGATSKLPKVIEKSLTSKKAEPYTIDPLMTEDERVKKITRTVVWQMALTIAERKGVTIVRLPSKDDSSLFSIKAERHE